MKELLTKIKIKYMRKQIEKLKKLKGNKTQRQTDMPCDIIAGKGENKKSFVFKDRLSHIYYRADNSNTSLFQSGYGIRDYPGIQKIIINRTFQTRH